MKNENSIQSADVIITDANNYAIALRYDAELDTAPIVLAKAKGGSVASMITKSILLNIPLENNHYVAKKIYKSTSIKENIPDILFGLCAEILARVYEKKSDSTN